MLFCCFLHCSSLFAILVVFLHSLAGMQVLHISLSSLEVKFLHKKHDRPLAGLLQCMPRIDKAAPLLIFIWSYIIHGYYYVTVTCSE